LNKYKKNSKKIQNYKNFGSLIIQKYIKKALLINKQKFDIRCYWLITSVNLYLKDNII